MGERFETVDGAAITQPPRQILRHFCVSVVGVSQPQPPLWMF